ncbi:MAG TPA: aryl-sulfate sulfotransferase [Chitinophagaceae bacterium]|nr:aryl-sulfate sulfotransferase [Chitinophagaceae bacterium]
MKTICKNALLFSLLLTFYLTACHKIDHITSVAAPKEILASHSVGGKGLLVRMDYSGNIISQKNTGLPAVNFQRWIFGNQIRYTFLEGDTSGGLKGVGYIPGSVVLLDTNLNVIKKIRLLPYADHDPNMDALDGHDFILIDDNHYIGLAYVEKVVTNIPASLNPAPACKVVTPIIQEVQNGNVIFEWDGSNYPEFYSTSVEGNQFQDNTLAHDYMHLNSMYIDPKDGNIICSFRNMDQVVKLNRKTGNIMWRLGGVNSDFPLSADQKPLRQHYATTTDNNQTLLMYDNGDVSLRPYTRILEFKLDEINKKVMGYKAFDLPNKKFYQFRGSVQKTDSSYFIGTGELKFMEINFTTGNIILDKNLANTSYRVLKY